jgi:hypothetical protein
MVAYIIFRKMIIFNSNQMDVQLDDDEIKIVCELVEKFQATQESQKKCISRGQSCCCGPINFAATIYTVDQDVVIIRVYENYDISYILRKIYSIHKDDFKSYILSDEKYGEGEWEMLTKKGYGDKTDLDYIHEAKGDTEAFMYMVSHETQYEYLMDMKPTYLIKLPISKFTTEIALNKIALNKKRKLNN